MYNEDTAEKEIGKGGEYERLHVPADNVADHVADECAYIHRDDQQSAKETSNAVCESSQQSCKLVTHVR